MQLLTTRLPLYLLTATLSFILACSGTATKAPATADVANPSKTCIEKIIADDEALGKTRNHACETIPLAATIRNYADALEQLNYTDCPAVFTEGFKKHIAAWRALIPFVENYPDMRGEMHDLFDVFEKGEDAEMFAPLLKAVWDTWGH